jgi:PAS domain S-box-containing protein
MHIGQTSRTEQNGDKSSRTSRRRNQISKRTSLKNKKDDAVNEHFQFTTELFNHVNDAIIAADTNGILTLWNAAAESMYGWKAEEVLGKNGMEVLQPLFPDLEKEEIVQHFATEGKYQGEITQVHKNGSRFPAEVHLFVVRSKRKKIISYVGISRNISERRQAEEKIYTSELRHYALIEALNQSNIGLFVVDRDYNTRFMNEAFKERFGDLTGRKCYTAVGSGEFPCSHCKMDEVINERKAVSYQFTTADDKTYYTSALPYIDTDGEICKLEVIQDITEIKRAEKKLRNSEERFQRAMEASQDGVWDWEIITGKTNYSPAYFTMLGYPPNNQLPTHINAWTELIHPDDRQKALNANRECIENRCERFEVEFRMQAQDGSWKWILGKGKAVERDAQGMATRMVGTHTDITARKQVEDVSRLLGAALNAAANLIVITNRDGTIEWVNPAFTLHTGYTEAEAVGKNPRNLVKSGKQDQEFYKRLWKTILDGKVWHGEIINRRKDGSFYVEEETITPLQDENGEIRHFISIKQDITKRKRSENIMKSRLRLMQFSASHSLEELLRFTLDELETLTGSAIGFYHFVEADQKTLQLQTWSTNTLNISSADANLSHYPMDMAGVWVDCVTQRHPVVHNNYSALLRSEGLPTGHAFIIRELTVPIMRNDRVVAIIGVGNKAQEYDENDVETVSQIADLTWDIIDQKRASEQLQEQIRHLRSMHIIDNAINSSFNLNITLNILIDQVITELKVDAISILLLNKDSFIFEHAASQGFKPGIVQRLQMEPGRGFAGQVIREGRAVHIPNLALEKNSNPEFLLIEKENFVAYYGVPLFSKGQIVGVMEIFNRKPLNPTLEWLDFLNSLAGQAAIAIDNVHLFENLQRSNFDLTLAYNATIEGWSRAMDLRDRETEGHTQRVTNLTLKLARQMGIAETEIVHIRRGALLHDMGKMGVPDAVLFKPGPLSAEEIEIMRQHTIYAHKMLDAIDYLKPALAIPYCHHEKWDGTGYPRGLKGDNIPLSARIFAVIDVWDALTSKRPYREAWSRQKTIAYIKSESGRHFDPNVVDAFLRLIEEEE